MSIRKLGGFLAAALVLLLGACTDGVTNAGGDGETSAIRVTANTSGTPIATLVVQVTAADITTPLAFNLVSSNGVATGTIKVPPGAARTFTVQAFDNTGAITHEGSATIDVSPGNNNPPLNISLGPRAGHVPVTVTFGAASVIVNPASATLLDDSTLQLQAVVINAEGDTLNVAVDWATNNPARATVSATGLVTAVDTGTVQIHATYEGLGGYAAITITLPGPPATGTFTWTGAVSTDWFTAGNWSANAVPTATDSVLIPAGPANMPALDSATTVAWAQVQAGATLTLGADFTVSTDVLADGPIQGPHRVIMPGTAATVRGFLPQLRVTGTVSLVGATSSSNITVIGGRLRTSGFFLGVTN
ncbi:Ig-like domain-containing protein [Longimicrobium sp.]|uniref:Ig-like domain-containing protein n=1 Tax=Longimicrobium sp. TaxID=2029185 RepID=UPI002E32597B|nr:Ig-like domain-containing protein [Longimicrobium sp.]HEX6037009.1 Ig-like domain-containing protein [Longimicrobium sp.]